MANYVFIAASIDGYIARGDGSIDWLTGHEDPTGGEYGYGAFIESIDAIVMGRRTYETVANLDPWPYPRPVFVLSSTLAPGDVRRPGVRVVSMEPPALVAMLKREGYANLYVDGGATIQGFLRHGLIDELIITRVPVLLGGGVPLFGPLERDVPLSHMETIVYPDGLVKSRYRVGR